MTAYAPEYYKHFKCIADRCTHSCCVGWRIELDEETVKKYESATCEYSDEVRRYISRDSDGAYIPTGICGRCPHLDSRGLCRIITYLGEEYLSDICREHPRFYNVVGDRVEIGIGASCPEAARLILEGDGTIVPLSDIDGYGEVSYAEYSALGLRDELFRLISECQCYDDVEAEIIELVLIPKVILSDEYRQEALKELEFLDEDDRTLLCAKRARESTDDVPMKRILTFFLYRHLISAESEEHAAAIVGFALFSARAVEAVSAVCGFAEALRIYSAEVEYSTDNTEDIIFGIESEMI